MIFWKCIIMKNNNQLFFKSDYRIGMDSCELEKRKIKTRITKIISSNELIFVVWDLMRLWMKWMIRKRLSSEWIDDSCKFLSADGPHA